MYVIVKKSKSSTFLVILILLTIWILTFLVTIFYSTYKDPISFQIGFLSEENLSQGDNVDVAYKISNYWPKEITSVELTYWIEDGGGSMKGSKSSVKLSENPVWFNSVSGNIEKSTLKLYSGDYRIMINITYTNTHEELDWKELSLQFNIK